MVGISSLRTTRISPEVRLLIKTRRTNCFRNTPVLTFEAPEIELMDYCPSDEEFTILKELAERQRKMDAHHNQIVRQFLQRNVDTPSY